jgi:hypothetical protein
MHAVEQPRILHENDGLIRDDEGFESLRKIVSSLSERLG